MRVPPLILALGVTIGCRLDNEPRDSDMIHAVSDLTPCTRPIDSLRVARIALDTVDASYRARGTPLQFTIRRFEPDSAAGMVRITTMPRAGQPGQDNRAIVLMDCDGRVFDLIPTDTANAPDA
jgi:hypothetical protein